MASTRHLLKFASKFEGILNKLDVDSPDHVPECLAKELFHIGQGVQTFFVTSGGETSTFSDSSSLSIFQFEETSEDRPDTFLQVGGWTHPLVKGVSPCLQTEDGAILFPDLDAEIDTSSSYVGLVLLDDIPLESHKQLIVMLKRYTAFKSLLCPEKDLGTIGKILVKGAGKAVQKLERGVDKAGVLIEYVAEKGQEKVSKNEKDVKVSSKVKDKVKAIKDLTCRSVKVSGFVVERVELLTSALANYLVKRYVTNNSTLSSFGTTSKEEKDGSSVEKRTRKRDKAMYYLKDIHSGGFLAFDMMHDSLENSGKVLGRSVKENSVKVTKAGYGDEAAEVVDDALTAAGNATITFFRVRTVLAKGLLKKGLRRKGLALAKDVAKKTSSKIRG